MRAALTSLFLLAAVSARAATVTNIDVPGAQFTYAESISPSGIVGGGYAPGGSDPCGQQCGFLRTPGGTFQTFSVFDAYNAGVTAVLDDGTSVGNYIKGRHTRGFARTPDGTLADIFIHDSNTEMEGINTSGIALGSASGLRNDAFLRTPDGKIELLTLKGCGFASGAGINAAGAVAGFCIHKDKGASFLRTLDGKTTLLKNHGWKNMGVGAIDDTGTVVGGYVDKQTGAEHGYIRDADGTYHSFELPGDNPINTYIIAMTVVGADRQVVGWLTALDGRDYGFIHHANGSDEIFDVSGGHASRGGTNVSGISPSGVVVGYYFDDNLRPHGYIRTP
jgi:hypothetical protein